jgi:tricorn protease
MKSLARPTRALLPVAAILLALSASPLASQEPSAGYYQFPSLHGETLVFSSESDLWRVPVTGGAARRLTSHPAPESEPHLSPDGRWLAFTGRYDGTADVYRMPAAGGPVERLTHEPDEVRVQGWTPDGRILYASQGGVGPSWYWVLRALDPESREVDDIPLADAREGTFDDQGTIWFTRFGLDVTADNVRAYRGGAMAQLWRFRPGIDDEAVRLAPDHEGNLTRPMWWNGQLFVVSDASGVANLWRMAPDGSSPTQLTRHVDFEVRGATLDRSGGRIVYQHGADLRVHDLASGEDRVVQIELGSDRARTRTRWIDDPMNWLNSVGFAPAGNRVALTARGRIVVVGTGELRRIELPLPAASRAREAVPGPDGRWIFAFVDAGGEQELWRLPADGLGEGEPLTSDAAGHRVGMSVSPDGSRVAHWDRRGRLFLLDVETRTNDQVDDARGAGYRDVIWSPDGRTLALVRVDTPVRRPQVVLLDVESSTTHTVTSDRYESYSPAFSPDGRWLWFLSDRSFTPTPGGPWGDRNTGPVFDQRTRIYALALQPGNAFPLAPRTEFSPSRAGDAGRAGGGARTDSGGGGGAGASTPAAGTGGSGAAGAQDLPAIDFEGLSLRLHEAPVPAGNYANLLVTGSRLYLLERAPGSGPVLRTLELGAERPRLTTFGEGITSAVLSADRSRMLVRRGSDLFIVPAGAQLPGDLADARVRAGSWRVAIEPADEWRQMLLDAWRMQRDFLYDPEFRGVDWAAVRDRYARLVERVGDRRELDELLRQMVAEVGVLHSQVRGGEYPSDPETASPAFLGGTFEPAPEGLRITHIYRTDPELPADRAPLARPGVDLAPGDIITRVNGRPVAYEGELARLLAHQAGEQVRVDFLRAGEEGAVVVQPVNAGRDAFLRYADWVTGRRDAVETATDGRVGYLHLRAMGAGDMAEFVREFFANLDRDGLVIDVRRNRGGNIDSWVIERLLRRAWSFWQPPGSDPYWNMQQAFRGHLVVLVDPLTYSDGETFSAGVQALGLGPIIGQRTAGAGVWLSDSNRLVDQGLMRAAQTPQFADDGSWILEGWGVEPDIEVENLPHATFQGHDAQLERAIEELLRALEADPVLRPEGRRMAPFPTPASARPGGG